MPDFPNHEMMQQQAAYRQLRAVEAAKNAPVTSAKKMMWFVLPVLVLAVVGLYIAARLRPPLVIIYGQRFSIQTKAAQTELPEGCVLIGDLINDMTAYRSEEELATNWTHPGQVYRVEDDPTVYYIAAQGLYAPAVKG